MEYLQLDTARIMRARRGSETVALSSALRGTKPQQTAANTIASNSTEYSPSNGQLMNTDSDGSSASSPSPKRGRAIYSVGALGVAIGGSSGSPSRSSSAALLSSSSRF